MLVGVGVLQTPRVPRSSRISRPTKIPKAGGPSHGLVRNQAEFVCNQ